MHFIGREQELNKLNQMYRKKTFQMLILYGRRRAGKTTLLNEFSKDKNPIFYTAIESKDEENLREFSRVVFEHFNPGTTAAAFASYGDILSYISASISNNRAEERQLIIIDEYPYMAANAVEFASVLQREIDHVWNQMNIMLILCGSSITFMEEKVLGEKSPLFGRRTAQLDLAPFDYLTSSRFVPDYSPEDKATVYGVTGGIPKYLSLFDPDLSLDDNIENNFFSKEGYFYEEPKNLLRQEFRDISLYFAIINAIGSGSTQVNEMAGKTGFDTAKISQALRKLEAVRIVRKEVPILNEKNKKFTQYALEDGMFRFWFRFVPRGTGAIERDFGIQYYQNIVSPLLHDYMGPVFETICQDYVFRKGMEGEYGYILTRTGKWRGNDPVMHCPADIDVVGVNDADKTAVIGECKFKNEPFDKKELVKFVDRARLISPFAVTDFLIFSLGGVTDWVERQTKENPHIRVVSMEQLYGV